MKILSGIRKGIERARGALAQQGRPLRKYGSWPLLAVILLLPFIFRPYAVIGGSMEPTLHDGQIVLVEKITPHVHIWRGEVLVILNPHDHKVTELKRVVGLPNERITLGENNVTVVGKDGHATTYGADTSIGLPGTGFFDIQLGPEDYMVLGDNRSKSSDSRSFGAVQMVDIIGHVIMGI